ncbi:MAG: serine--tRNA ligase [Candidatus Parcubacteria bacterium]|nr:serine--tRNA ligase [Candidatus Parcubacteria bacterium]
MLDIKFIRENADLITAAGKKKHLDFDVAKLLEVDDKRKEALLSLETMRADQNAISDKIPNVTAEERPALIAESKAMKDEMEKKEEALREVMKEWQGLMLCVPNIPDISVPEGESDADNVEYSVWGDIPKFDFEPKGHVELMGNLNMVDFERGSKVAGYRGYFLKNDAVLLELAVWNLVVEILSKRGFSPMFVPSHVKRETMMGTGYLPQGEEDTYHTQDGTYLAGTGEVAGMGYYMNEIVPAEKFPIKMLAFSPCFRREAGAAGKDTKGLMRVHEFMKWEQIILCEASHMTSVEYHEELRQNAEDILQALEIPYHVVINCGGDLGQGQVKKYDIEAWVPSEGKYRETHSCSYFHDFQTRRLGIRYKDADGKLRFAHSLNNTALAFPRALIPLIENHQQADGSIKIPKALQKWMGKEVITQ